MIILTGRLKSELISSHIFSQRAVFCQRLTETLSGVSKWRTRVRGHQGSQVRGGRWQELPHQAYLLTTLISAGLSEARCPRVCLWKVERGCCGDGRVGIRPSHVTTWRNVTCSNGGHWARGLGKMLSALYGVLMTHVQIFNFFIVSHTL